MHRPVELLDDAGRRVDAGLLDHRLEERREVVEEGEVGLDPLADARALHLHDHPLAGVRAGAVDLGDGRARERPLVEGGEDRLDRPAEPALDLARAPRRGRRAGSRPGASRAPPPSGRGGGPGRVERSCPSFVKVGPSSARSGAEAGGGVAAGGRGRLALDREGRRGRARRAAACGRGTRRSRACATAAAIWRRRFRSWNARSNMGPATVAAASRGRSFPRAAEAPGGSRST